MRRPDAARAYVAGADGPGPVWLLVLALFFAPVAAGSVVPFERCFELSARAHGVPLELLHAVARTESSLNPDARSHANAHGIMQIQWPGTARHLGVRRVAELYNPCLNIDLGARYLAELTERYGGDVTRALAAYNYGPGRIGRETELPAGARAYVERVERFRRAEAPAAARLGGSRLPLALFSSALRAERMAAQLQRMLGEGQVVAEATGDGHRVVLQIPPDGLSAAALRRLGALGFAAGP